MKSFRTVIWLVVTTLLLGVVACGGAMDPASLIAKAEAYRKKGQIESAIIELRNALQENPDLPEARFLIGTAYLQSGEAGFATVELQKALQLGYDPKRVLPELAKSLIAQEKFREALDATDPQLIPDASGSPEILNVRAYAQLLSRQLAAAKSSLDLAMILRPEYADGLLSQARIALGEGDGDKAAALVERALSVEPRNVDGWLLKASMQRQAGNPNRARISYEKAIEIDPRNAAVRIDFASLEIETRRSVDAARELEALRKIAPKNVMGLYLQALLELRTGNHKRALETTYKALELEPKHVPSTLLAGVAELALGNPERAQKHLSAALEVDSRNVYGRKVLAATQLRNGQAAQAAATLEPVLDRGSGASDPALLALAGEVYMQNREYARATRYFEKAAALDPNRPAVRIGLGMSRLALGATDRAVADLEAAAALGPGGAHADIMLAMVNIQRKEYDQALKTIDKLEKANPNNTVLYNMKAAAYMGKGDVAQARAQFERALQIDPSYLPAAANLVELDLQAGSLDAARRRYDRVLEKDKKQVPAMLALAELLSRTRGPEPEILSLLQRAKAESPDSLEPTRVEIDHYRRTGQLDKAIRVATEQRTQHPRDPAALDTLGKLFMAAGRAHEAVGVYADRAFLTPNMPESQLDLAGAQMLAKDPAGASATLRKALRMRLGYPEAQAALVAAELAQDRIDQAMSVAQDVQRDLPSAPLGYVLEGDVLVATKKYARAAVLYEKAFALRKSGIVAIKLRDAWALAGNPDKGDSRLKEWLAEHKDDVAARRHLAFAMMQRGKHAQAVEQYRLVLEQQPKDRIALNNTAWALSKLKDPAALRYAKEAYELKTEDGMIADTYAQILIESGDIAWGLAVLQKAVGDAPSNPEVRYHLAQALAKSGEKQKAIAQLEIVVASAAGFPQGTEAAALLAQLRK